MNCALCESANAPERNYCGACGSPLARYCRLCGFRNQALDRFCGGCGASLADGPVLAAGETPAEVPPKAPSRPAGPVDDVSELLDAAREAEQAGPEDAEIRVNQSDIDSLFGE